MLFKLGKYDCIQLIDVCVCNHNLPTRVHDFEPFSEKNYKEGRQKANYRCGTIWNTTHSLLLPVSSNRTTILIGLL